MTKRFINFIDLSLLPFSLVILAKVIGLYVVIRLLNIDWGIANFGNNIISVTPLVYAKDIHILASYSNLILFSVLFLGFSIQLLISNLRQTSRTNNNFLRLAIRMSTLNVFSKGLHLYTKIYIWLFYVWLVVGYILLDFILGRSDLWVCIVSLVLAIIITAVLIMDTVKEYNNVLKFARTQGFF